MHTTLVRFPKREVKCRGAAAETTYKTPLTGFWPRIGETTAFNLHPTLTWDLNPDAISGDIQPMRTQLDAPRSFTTLFGNPRYIELCHCSYFVMPVDRTITKELLP